ncbi:hypothetical protein ABZ093_02805 [Streptomyces cyaneofuscatus]|uniref:hypothetical protein n=1 Tax=Streptomyces cyaneofuscatus TaxID=66883 RepID=UPI0033A5C094
MATRDGSDEMYVVGLCNRILGESALDLAGDGFANQQHAAAFLWWAKDQLGGRPAA